MDTRASSSRPSTGILGFMGRRKRSATVSNAATATAPPSTTASTAVSPIDQGLESIVVRGNGSSNATQPATPGSSTLSPGASSNKDGHQSRSTPSSPRATEDAEETEKDQAAAKLAQRIMKRRSVGQPIELSPPPASQRPHTSAGSSAAASPPPPNSGPKYHKIRFVPYLSPSGRATSLQFEPIVRQVKTGRHGLTIGRYLDPLAIGLRKDIFDFDFEAAALMGGSGKSNDDKKSDKVTFKSKVVSRMHAQMWVDETGQVSPSSVHHERLMNVFAS